MLSTVSNPEGRAQPFSVPSRVARGTFERNRSGDRCTGRGGAMSGGSPADGRSRRSDLRALEVFETDPGPLSLSELGRGGCPCPPPTAGAGLGAPSSAPRRGYRLASGFGARRGDELERRLRRTCAGFTPGSPPGRARRRGQHAGGDRLSAWTRSPAGTGSIRWPRGRRDPAVRHQRRQAAAVLGAAPAGGRSAGGRYSPADRALADLCVVFAGQLAFAQRNGYAWPSGVVAPASPRVGPDGPGGLVRWR